MSMEQFDFNKVFARGSAKSRTPYDRSQMTTRVSVDLDESDKYTLLDVQTADYPGLLYRISLALVDAGVNIVSARITTEKGAALDTFYLCDKNGGKITSETLLAGLISEVEKRIVE